MLGLLYVRLLRKGLLVLWLLCVLCGRLLRPRLLQLLQLLHCLLKLGCLGMWLNPR